MCGLCHRLSKHKPTRHVENLREMTPPWLRLWNKIEISGCHTPAMPSMSLWTLNDKSLRNWNFQNRVCHFWIRTGNERPVNSEPAIYKLLAFCTMYSREAAFSKLIIIKSKARFFLKNVENAFCPACLASSYERMTRVRINKCVHPISYAR